jgi:maltose/moltooligosaccharide transporter
MASMKELPKITPFKMASLGIGWLGFNFFWAFHSATIPLFLKNFTQSKFLISLVLSLPGVAGCIIPPVVGYFSDRTTTRFGRRAPYIFVGMLCTFIFILWLPKCGSFVTVAAVCGVMYFSLRVAETPYLSLLPDITPPNQRGTASGMMNLFGSIGLIAFFIIGSQIWDIYPNGVFYIVAFVSFIFSITAILILKKHDVADDGAESSGPADKIGIFGYLKGIIQETNVLKLFVAQFFWWLGFWMMTSFLTLFVSESLNVPEGSTLFVPMVFSIVATVFMLPMGVLGDRFGRKGIITVMLVFWAVSGALIGLSQNLTQAIVIVGITGIPYAAVIGIGYAFMLDLIPAHRTAEFVGLSTISVATSQILGPLIGGKVIDIIGYRLLFPTASMSMITGLIILQFVRSRKSE